MSLLKGSNSHSRMHRPMLLVKGSILIHALFSQLMKLRILLNLLSEDPLDPSSSALCLQALHGHSIFALFCSVSLFFSYFVNFLPRNRKLERSVFIHNRFSCILALVFFTPLKLLTVLLRSPWCWRGVLRNLVSSWCNTHSNFISLLVREVSALQSIIISHVLHSAILCCYLLS